MNQIYLDYNASTPVSLPVLEEMLPYLGDRYGNPSSSHSFGVVLRKAIEEARGRVAELIGCSPSEVIFTSGATEANNMVIKGVALTAAAGSHIITSSIEHPSVIEPCRYLERLGYKVTYLPVDRYGMVDPLELSRAITENTILVSIMHSNNEVGTIQPISALAGIASSHGIPFHTDASQSVGKVRCRVDELGVDFLTIAGHKFYAPKGIGALYIKKGQAMTPLMHGAGHERGMRPGTENAAFIVGLGKACEISRHVMDDSAERHRMLGKKLMQGLSDIGLDVRLNGHPDKRLPNTWNISFSGFEAPRVMQAMPGVAVSPGAACHNGTVAPSHVLTAMGTDPALARGAIRFSFGRETTEDDIKYVVEVLGKNLK